MARRKDMLTEKKNPLALEVYRALGVFFIALIESRWKSNVPIQEEFFSAISLSKNNEGEGTDRTWRRWKSTGKDNQLFLGDRPELVLVAVEWAKTCQNLGFILISDDEALKISESFRTLLDWNSLSKDLAEELQGRVHGITDSIFEIADLELIENPDGYRDKQTGETFDYLTLVNIGQPNVIGRRTEKELVFRSSAFDLMKKAEKLANQTLANYESHELAYSSKQEISSQSYANKKAILRELIIEGEFLVEKVSAVGGEPAVKELLNSMKVKNRALVR